MNADFHGSGKMIKEIRVIRAIRVPKCLSSLILNIANNMLGHFLRGK